MRFKGLTTVMTGSFSEASTPYNMGVPRTILKSDTPATGGPTEEAIGLALVLLTKDLSSITDRALSPPPF